MLQIQLNMEKVTKRPKRSAFSRFSAVPGFLKSISPGRPPTLNVVDREELLKRQFACHHGHGLQLSTKCELVTNATVWSCEAGGYSEGYSAVDFGIALPSVIDGSYSVSCGFEIVAEALFCGSAGLISSRQFILSLFTSRLHHLRPHR